MADTRDTIGQLGTLVPDMPEQLRVDLRNLIMEVLDTAPGSGTLTRKEISEVLGSLPRLIEQDLINMEQSDSVCPVCFNSFMSILAEEEMALALDSPAYPAEELGVTRLERTCEHVFCRRDISRWISEGHESCPLCRRSFLEGHPSSEAGPDTQEPSNALLATLQDRLDLFRSIPPDRHLLALDGQDINTSPALTAFFRPVASSHENEHNNADIQQDYVGMYS